MYCTALYIVMTDEMMSSARISALIIRYRSLIDDTQVYLIIIYFVDRSIER